MSQAGQYLIGKMFAIAYKIIIVPKCITFLCSKFTDTNGFLQCSRISKSHEKRSEMCRHSAQLLPLCQAVRLLHHRGLPKVQKLCQDGVSSTITKAQYKPNIFHCSPSDFSDSNIHSSSDRKDNYTMSLSWLTAVYH